MLDNFKQFTGLKVATGYFQEDTNKIERHSSTTFRDRKQWITVQR